MISVPASVPAVFPLLLRIVDQPLTATHSHSRRKPPLHPERGLPLSLLFRLPEAFAAGCGALKNGRGLTARSMRRGAGRNAWKAALAPHRMTGDEMQGPRPLKREGALRRLEGGCYGRQKYGPQSASWVWTYVQVKSLSTTYQSAPGTAPPAGRDASSSAVTGRTRGQPSGGYSL